MPEAIKHLRRQPCPVDMLTEVGGRTIDFQLPLETAPLAARISLRSIRLVIFQIWPSDNRQSDRLA
jgi:hypothetical protein